VPRIALTATADQLTRAEIAQRLQLDDARQFVSSFDRPNIRYAIVEKTTGRKQLLDFISTEHPGDSGIVYCLSRKKVEETAEFLNENGIRALPYHAGMEYALRAENQARFLREENIVMVATIAFGMGIDKPDVRFVCHLDLPKSSRAITRKRAAPAATACRLERLDGLWFAGRGAAAPDDRRVRSRREFQARAGVEARRHAGPVRDAQLPAHAPARILRRALRPLRQLRYLPDPAGVSMRRCRCKSCSRPSTGSTSASPPAT
jgi:hypothetical protein